MNGFCKTIELVKYLSLSRSTIRQLVSEGMPCYRVGSAILFKYEEVDEWMQRFKAVADGEQIGRMVDEIMAGL